MSSTGTDLAFTPALALARLVRDGEVTSAELVDLYLERIERLDPRLNAFVTVDAEGARRAAEEHRDGPFAGVPIAIKDLTPTAGLRTTFSSRHFADYVPEEDAAVVRRIREAGFVILGKTNTPELGTVANTESELNGACRNPWDTSRTTGGSSGGSAAAVAAGLAPIAEGTDGGGSIRIPASCCGLFGLKPARGRVSRAPVGNGVVGLTTYGPLARTVSDAAALLDVMAGYELGDSFTAPPPERPFLEEVGADPGRLRVRVTVQPPFETDVHPACTAAARACGEVLAELGHEVEESGSPFADQEAPRLFGRVWTLGPALSGVPIDELEPMNRMLAGRAQRTTAAELGVAVRAMETFARRAVSFWRDVDVLVTPTLAQPPVPVGWAFAPEDPREQFRQQFRFTPFTSVVNVTGQPACSVPFAEHDGVPIGVHLIGKPWAEATLIRLAAQLERARPWADRRPPVS